VVGRDDDIGADVSVIRSHFAVIAPRRADIAAASQSRRPEAPPAMAASCGQECRAAVARLPARGRLPALGSGVGRTSNRRSAGQWAMTALTARRWTPGSARRRGDFH